jgi:hypothetical protein
MKEPDDLDEELELDEDEGVEEPSFDENADYSKKELEEWADALLREDANRELCRKCKEANPESLPYGEETGEIEWQIQKDKDGVPLFDNEGNTLYVAFPELQCKAGHRWYKGEGPRRDIRGKNPILFESHLYNRKRREIQVECTDDQTECLTLQKGWTSVDNLSTSDTILSFDADERHLTWTPIYKINRAEVDDLSMVHHYGRRFDTLTTLDHRWPIHRVNKTRTTEFIDTVTTQMLSKSSTRAFILSAPMLAPTNKTYTDEFIRLIAWITTEGHVWGRPTSPRIAITQSPTEHPQYCSRIERDISSLGADWTVFAPGSNNVGGTYQRREGLFARLNVIANGGYQYVLSGTEVDKFVEILGFDKVVPISFLAKLTADQLSEYYSVLLYGDGNNIKQNLSYGRSMEFYQKRKDHSDSAMAACVLGGFSCSLQNHSLTRDRNNFVISSGYKWLHRIHKESVSYTGQIWCPTTPTGFWLARRNGKTFVTGNSGTPDPAFTMDRWGKHPTTGIYNRCHPLGRKVNSIDARKKSGSSFYK